MSEADERRERYRLTVYRAIERGDDPADATMAVADEEIQREHLAWAPDVVKLHRENARLRAELRDIKELAAKRESWLISLRATIARVRSVLDDADHECLDFMVSVDDVRAALKTPEED